MTTVAMMATVGAVSAAVLCVVDPTSWVAAWTSPTLPATIPGATTSNFVNTFDANGTWWVRANVSPNPERTVAGRSRCANFGGSLGGVSPSNVNVWNLPEGESCWCQMVEPWVGPWTHSGSTATMGTSPCFSWVDNGCANLCANMVRTNQIFRAAILSLP